MHACTLSKMGLSNKRFWISICWRKTLFTEVEHYKIRAFPYSIPNIIKTRKREREKEKRRPNTDNNNAKKWNGIDFREMEYFHLHTARNSNTLYISRCEYFYFYDLTLCVRRTSIQCFHFIYGTDWISGAMMSQRFLCIMYSKIGFGILFAVHIWHRVLFAIALSSHTAY